MFVYGTESDFLGMCILVAVTSVCSIISLSNWDNMAAEYQLVSFACGVGTSSIYSVIATLGFIASRRPSTDVVLCYFAIVCLTIIWNLVVRVNRTVVNRIFWQNCGYPWMFFFQIFISLKCAIYQYSPVIYIF